MIARTRMRLRILGVIVGIACSVTPLFNWLTTGIPVSMLQGLLDGFIISSVVGGYLLFIQDGLLRPWMRRWSFSASLLLNSAILVALFLVGRALGQVLTSGDPGEFAQSFRDVHLAYASVFFALTSIAMIFAVQVNRMIGPNVLRYFVLGSYHRPRDENRVFMFLDLEGSTRLTEELGGLRYYALLRHFVDDLSDPVLESRGQIYQYAGDEVVITWRESDATTDARCIRCYFDIMAALEARTDTYERDFGTVPRFRAGLHGGPVIAGELGDLKQEIVYVGDTLNVAARLEEHAKRHGLGLVVSDELLARMKLPDDLHAEPLGRIDVRGKRDGIAVTQVSGGHVPLEVVNRVRPEASAAQPVSG